MTTEQETAAQRVAELHGPHLADVLTTYYPAALPLVADGWTVDGALSHITGSCDHMACTGDHS